MSHIALGVTGSVAAIRTPALAAALTEAGHDVRVIATEPSLYFFDPNGLPQPPAAAPDPLGRSAIFRDEDEWPRSKADATGARRYQLTDPVLHIEIRRWADLLLVAPLDANTLARFAYGLSDNLLTCLYRAWDRTRPIIVAPAMNTLMWDHPLTRQHLRLLLQVHGEGSISPPEATTLDELIETINHSCPRFSICGPRTKQLACGDVGMGGMAEVAEIAAKVEEIVAAVTDGVAGYDSGS